MSVHVRLDTAPGAAQDQRGIGITGFVTALSVAVIIFFVQVGLFLYLRSKQDLSHVYNPKSNGEPPDAKNLLLSVVRFSDKDVKLREGSDAYYFLRYLKTLLKIFLPIFVVVVPILIPLNYVKGRGRDLDPSPQELSAGAAWQVMGLDTLAFGNVRSSNTDRYAAHLVCSLLVVVWFCFVAYTELRDFGPQNREQDHSSKERLHYQHYLTKSLEPEVDKVKKIDRLLRKRDETLDRFESAATALIRRKTSSSLQFKTKWYGRLLNHVENNLGAEMRTSNGPSELCSGQNENGSRCKWCSEMESAWRNIVWSNVGLTKWERGFRAALVMTIVAAMIILWALPVSWTAALSQLDNLIRNEDLRSFFQRHETLKTLAVSLAGVLPGAALALMLMLIPPVLEFLSRLNGAKLRSEQAAFVQRFYFIFLFTQMFLIVSIASFFTSSFNQFIQNLETLRSSEKILSLLSQNLPTAANYFFSYMILQALSGSSNLMMQRAPMFWFLTDKLFSYSPRQKWLRRDSIDIVGWASMFPLYTTLACISLAYSVIAPLISFFAIVSFALLWLAHKYTVIYVSKLESDHGGVLYPRAINQTFTGIYVMQLCMVGLFIGVRDDAGRQSCLPHGIVMIISLVMTAIFQVILNAYVLSDLRSKSGFKNTTNHKPLQHLALVGKPSIAWLPSLDAKDNFVEATVSVDCNFPPRAAADIWWWAKTDEKGHVQILKSQRDKSPGNPAGN